MSFLPASSELLTLCLTPSLPVSKSSTVARPSELGHNLNKASGRGAVGPEVDTGRSGLGERRAPIVCQAPRRRELCHQRLRYLVGPCLWRGDMLID